jgi:hypothetical protein
MDLLLEVIGSFMKIDGSLIIVEGQSNLPIESVRIWLYPIIFVRKIHFQCLFFFFVLIDC